MASFNSVENLLGPVPGIGDDPALYGWDSLLNDTIIPVEMFEVEVGDKWSVVDRETFRSWTGRRKYQGQEVHGAVYNYLSPEGSDPFTGMRSCQCKECQRHVAPRYKAN